jgi:hypothetical protein
MVSKHLGSGIFPDVAFFQGRIWAAWQNGSNVLVVALNAETLVDESAMVTPIGPEAGAFVRLLAWDGRLWMAYRAGGPNYHVILRDMSGSHQEALGVGHGNDCVALGSGYVAWQRTGAPSYDVWLKPLSGSVPERRVRDGRPTGLSRILLNGDVRMVDEDRLSVAGHTRPCWADDLVVAEGAQGGTFCRLNDGRELLLWPGQEAFTPRCAAVGEDKFAIPTWDRNGVRIVLVSRDEFQVSSTEPIAPVLDTTSTVDVLDYLPIGVALEGSHLYACRYTGQQPNVFSIAKHPDGGGEWWAHDDAWVYHHMDQGGSPIQDVAAGQFHVRRDAQGNRIDAYYFAPDARWMPRRVKTGDELAVETRIYRIADGSSEPWRHLNRFQLFSSFPSPIGTGRAMVMTYDPRRHRDPNGRLQGRYEKGVYVVVNGRKYHRWEDWRTKDDNSGEELMQQTEFRQIDTAPSVTWRLSRRPAIAPLLPIGDDMHAPGVTVDRYGPVIGPTGTWSVEFHDRNNEGFSGKVEIVNGSVHVTITNPEGSDRSGNRRPVEVRGV